MPAYPFQHSHPAFFCKKAADDIISIFLRVLCCKVHKPNFDCMFNVQAHFQHQMPQVHIQSRQLLQICKIQILVHSLPLAFYAFFVVCAVGCKLHVIIIILQKIHCFFFRSLPECDAFDAIGHSFATIAIGGFSTHDASIGYFDSPTINTIIAIFLLISGCNYGLHFSLLSGRSLKVYWRDPEFRMFIGVQFTLVVICTLVLWFHNVYSSALMTINQAFFQVVSMATTAGFTTDSIARWPLFLPVLLLCSAFIGGCAGSTGGGLKVIRILLLFKQGNRELKRLVHPNAVYSIKLGNRALPERILEAVWGFFSAYALVFIVSMLAIIATGVDDFSAFASVVATLNNLGPGLGVVADNFTSMNPVAKWILIANMLFGRLEVFTLLVLFTPTFWRE